MASDETQLSTPIFRPSSHRNPSFSSISSFSSTSSSSSSLSTFTINNPEDYYFSSRRTPLRFSGVPFSWEQIPGIAKRQVASNNINNNELCDDSDDNDHLILPLPPAGNYNSRKSTCDGSFQKDPFFTALMECSKDHHRHHHHDSAKVTRTLSDRIGFINMYTSCKRTCSVSESIVSLPSSRSRSNYDILRRRR